MNVGSKHLKAVSALFLAILSVNLFASFTFTDFWASDFPLIQKLAMYSKEVIATVLVGLVFCCVAYFIARITGLRLSYAFYGLFFVPCVFFVLANWLFFSFFSRFAGVYGLQTLLYDGRAVLGIGSEFGDMQNLPIGVVLFSVLVICLVTVALCFRTRFGDFFQLASTAVVAILVISSIIFSVPGLDGKFIGANAITDSGYLRIVSSKKASITAKAGPFSSILQDAAALLQSNDSEILSSINLQSIVDSSDVSNRVESDKLPNIVFILVESMRPDVLKAFGGDGSVMPNVESLSAAGLTFKNTWAQSSHSNYADIAALSGQYPLRSETIHFYPEYPAYPRSLPWEHLASYGYRSAGFSSGDDNWGRMLNYLKTESLDIYDHAGSNLSKETALVTENSTDVISKGDQTMVDFSGFMVGESKMYGTSRLDEVTTAKALSWVDQQSQNDPFFLYLNYQASHAPYTNLPSEYQRKFLTEASPEADKVRAGLTIGLPIKLIVDSYYDALSYVDFNIGNLVDHIEALHGSGETLYIVSADTSMMIGSQMIGNGGALHKEVLHIPLVVSGSQVQQAEELDVAMSQIDILPTVYGLLGLPYDPAAQGEDVRLAPDKKRYVFSLAQSPAAHQYSVLYDNWQMLVDLDDNTITNAYVGPVESKDNVEFPQETRLKMAEMLDVWVSAQLGYYSNSKLQNKYFPPSYQSMVDAALEVESECEGDECLAVMDE